MNRRMRGRIFERMLTFVRRVDLRYRCFCLFGGPRDFKRNILKKIKAKEI